MLKKISSLIILFGGLLLAQSSDYEKDKLKNNPKLVEESFTKAVIRANIIEDYVQEFHTKKTYNQAGNITQIESFGENGDLNYTEYYTYDDAKIIKIEAKNPNEDFVIIRDFEYNENGYVVTKSENDIVVQQTTYVLNQDQKIVSEKEVNFLDENLVSERVNEYANNQLNKTEVKYNNGGYTVNFKYNTENLPVEETVVDLNKKLVSKKIRVYDQHQNITEENNFDSFGKLKTNNRVKYEYDDKGNWIIRTQFANNLEQPISNSKRTIRY